MQRTYEPADFKVGTRFVGNKKNIEFQVKNIYHKMYTTAKGKRRLKKEITVAFIKTGSNKIHTADIKTLCKLDITIL